jgi:hypothetical protein
MRCNGRTGVELKVHAVSVGNINLLARTHQALATPWCVRAITLDARYMCVNPCGVHCTKRLANGDQTEYVQHL